MKISIDEDKLRRFLYLSEPLFEYLKIRESDIKKAAWENSIKALILLKEIKDDIGLKENKPDKGNKLLNGKLF